MDYFNNVLTTFLGLECVSSVAVYAGSELSDFIKNILICVLIWTKTSKTYILASACSILSMATRGTVADITVNVLL